MSVSSGECPLLTSEVLAFSKGCTESQKAPHSSTLGGRFRRFQRTLTGWRVSVKFCAIATFTLSILNISVTAWIATHNQTYNGQHVLYEGYCSQTAKLNTITHLALNTLSTILLGTSSYCMQCLSAPTREELDKAHSKSRWLHVGILSPRNLANISRIRVIMWCTLGIATIPVHLL